MYSPWVHVLVFSIEVPPAATSYIIIICLHVIVVSGEIMTLVVLDYEIVPNYHLRIRATDMGSPTLFSKLIIWLIYISAIHIPLLQCPGEADVNIQVVDFNDCPPEFVEPPPSYTIPEDAILGSVLVDFTINDCDSGLNGANGSRFSIIAGAQSDYIYFQQSYILRQKYSTRGGWT